MVDDLDTRGNIVCVHEGLLDLAQIGYDEVEVRVCVKGMLDCPYDQGNIRSVVSYVHANVVAAELKFAQNVAPDPSWQRRRQCNNGGTRGKKARIMPNVPYFFRNEAPQ